MKLSKEKIAMLEGLPGSEFVIPGLDDIGRGNFETAEALLVLMAVPRMASCGFAYLEEACRDAPENLEMLLYEKLGERNPGDPYGEYNSLRRRLSSFLSAMESRWRRELITR